MRSKAKPPRENRTIPVDFQNEATYVHLLGDGKAWLEFVFAFLLSIGFQLTHKASCGAGECLSRHSHSIHVRLHGIIIWRLQGTRGTAVLTVLPQGDRILIPCIDVEWRLESHLITGLWVVDQ